jgi:hypothetical protein
MRRSVAEVCLWLAVLTLAISVGGNLFQMVVIDPIWSASPPESVRAFFVGTPFLAALRRFHTHPLLQAGAVCLLAALILNRNVPTLRKWILLAVGIQLLIVLPRSFMSTRSMMSCSYTVAADLMQQRSRP